MSHRNPFETLEPRSLLSAPSIPKPPPTDPGVFAVGRTIYVNGTGGNDSIQINAAPNDSKGKAQPRKIQVQMNTTQPVFDVGRKRKFIINGGAGNDTIRVSTGLTPAFHPDVIVIRGGDGNDTITGSEHSEKIFGDAGDDIITGFGGNDTLSGGAGNDRLDGGAGNDRIHGDDGNDTLVGGTGNDALFGGLGDDTFQNNEPAGQRTSGVIDLIDGGGGNDTSENDPADHYRLINH